MAREPKAVMVAAPKKRLESLGQGLPCSGTLSPK